MDELHEKEPHRFTCLHFKLGMTCYKGQDREINEPNATCTCICKGGRNFPPPPYFFLFFQISMSITTHAITLHKSGNTLYNMSPFPSLFPFCSL
jgi:hypothetical protein